MKRLIFTLFIGSALVGCYRNTDREDGRDNMTPNHVAENGNNNGANGDSNGVNNDRDRDGLVDRHHGYVTGLGFSNVTNPNGNTYHQSYRLSNDYAKDNEEVFHQWRHTWVEPSEYIDKDIHVYRYTGMLDGEERVIHVLSHNDEIIGGYHHGTNETYENARILGDGTHNSRVANDFRQTWDDMFGVNR